MCVCVWLKPFSLEPNGFRLYAQGVLAPWRRLSSPGSAGEVVEEAGRLADARRLAGQQTT